MKKLLFIIMTLGSITSYASAQFQETADLAEKYLASYEKGKSSKENTKSIISLFAKESTEEISRLVKGVSNHDVKDVRDAKLVYSKSNSLIIKIEKNFPSIEHSKLSNLADDMVEVCKRENETYRLPGDHRTDDNYSLVSDMCGLQGRVIKYLKSSNF